MAHFDGLADLVLELLAHLIKAIKAREIRILSVLSQVFLDVHNLLGGEAAPGWGQYLK